jgi:hypothetical protein
MRDPRAHKVEDVTVHTEFLIELADRGDSSCVYVGDETRQRIEVGIVCGIVSVEEASRERSVITIRHSRSFRPD